MGTDVNPGQQSIGARAIEARAAIATAHLRSTVTSISSAVDPTSAHGERIIAAIDGLVVGMAPALEAAENVLHGVATPQLGGGAPVGAGSPFRSAPRASAHRGVGVLS